MKSNSIFYGFWLMISEKPFFLAFISLSIILSTYINEFGSIESKNGSILLNAGNEEIIGLCFSKKNLL